MRKQRMKMIPVVLALLISTVSCNLLGPDKPKKKQVTVTAVDAETEALLDSLTISIDGTVVVENVESYTLTESKGTTVTIEVVRDGYITKTRTVTVETDRQVEIPLAEKPPETVTKTITPTDGDIILKKATHTDHITGDTLGNGQVNLTFPTDTTIVVKTAAEGYVSEITDVIFTNSDPVEITLVRDYPETVTLTYAITAEDDGTLADVTLVVADSLVAEEANGSVTLPFSQEPVSVCGDASYYEASCDTLTLSEDREVNLTLAREQITIKITPKIIGYGDYVTENDGQTLPSYIYARTAYVLQIGESIWINDWPNSGREVDYDNLPVAVGDDPGSLYMGEGIESTVTYPAGPDDLEVTLWTQYFPKEGHEYSLSDDNFLNVAEGSIELSGDTDSDIVLDLDHIPACSDGIDNDFYDGVDADDPGCLDLDGVYDPEDDVELTRVTTKTTQVFSNPKGKEFVSGKQGEQILKITLSKSHPSMQVAFSSIAEVAVKVEEDQAGEEFALRWSIGKSENSLNNAYTSDIIPDEGLGGWKVAHIYNPLRHWKENPGVTYYKLEAVHATELADTTSDGNDDVVFLEEDAEENYYVIGIQWIYQPERVPESAGKSKMTADPNTTIEMNDVGAKTDTRN